MNQNSNGNMPVISLSKILVLLLLTSSFFFQTSVSFAQVQTQKAITSKMVSNVNGYYESLPVDYATNTSKKYPLLIFIHGKGEIGNGTSQLSYVLRNGPPKLISQGKFPSSFTVNGQTNSFIVISPQLASGSYSLAVSTITNIINFCKAKYRVDEARVYLTGLSMGATMGWSYVGSGKANADKLAGSLLVCSGGTAVAGYVSSVATSKLPMWFTHNSGDNVLKSVNTIAVVNAINAFIPVITPKAKITIFNKSGHDAWTATYDPAFKQDGLNVYEWMLSSKRGTSSQPNPSPPVPPVANAGTNQVITLPTSTVTLDGSKSTSTTGTTISKYAWTKTSGPAATITSAAASKTTVTGLTAGTYVFTLVVTDSKTTTDNATVTVTVNASAAVPTANAGSAQTITLPTTSVSLDGSKSVASAGNSISSYAWVKYSGGASTITSPTSSKTTITGMVVGTYIFRLTVKDNKGKYSPPSSVTITVKAASSSSSTPPTSNAGANQTITLPTSSVTLNGSASVAGTGNTLTTGVWSKVSGPTAGTITTPSARVTTMTGLVAGTYVVKLTVTDNKGTSASSTTTITVNNGTSTVPLVSNAGKAQGITLPISAAWLDGTASTGPEGTTHVWKQMSGPATAILDAYSIKTVVSNLVNAGTYQFQLLLTDPASGKTSVSYVNIVVKLPEGSPTSQVPKADAGTEKTVTLPSSAVLDGTKSTFPAGSTFLWELVAGPPAKITSPTALQTTVTGVMAGYYQFHLTITDKATGKFSKASVYVKFVSQASARVASTDEVAANVVGDAKDVTLAEALTVKINPNPVQSVMTVWVHGKATGKANISIYNLQGQLLMQQEFVKDAPGSTSRTFNTSKLSTGAYVARVTVGERYRQAVKVVKQ